MHVQLINVIFSRNGYESKGPLVNRLEALRVEIGKKQPSVDDWLSVFTFIGQPQWKDRQERVKDDQNDSETVEDSRCSVEFYRKVLLLQSEIYKLTSGRKNNKESYSISFLELIFQFIDMFEFSLIGRDFSMKFVDRPFRTNKKTLYDNAKSKHAKISEIFTSKK